MGQVHRGCRGADQRARWRSPAGRRCRGRLGQPWGWAGVVAGEAKSVGWGLEMPGEGSVPSLGDRTPGGVPRSRAPVRVSPDTWGRRAPVGRGVQVSGVTQGLAPAGHPALCLSFLLFTWGERAPGHLREGLGSSASPRPNSCFGGPPSEAGRLWAPWAGLLVPACPLAGSLGPGLMLSLVAGPPAGSVG